MLAAGKITAEEAERLLAALEREPSSSAAPAGGAPKAKPRFLRVQIEDHNCKGPVNVNVRVPIQLLRAGVKLASVIPAEARSRVTMVVNRNGHQIDLNNLTAENLEEVIENIDDLQVNVDDASHTRIRMFCE
jgi:hypothetical protein